MTLIFRTLLICTVLASSVVCKFKNSPIHYIKLNSAGRGSRGGFDIQSLAKIFSRSKDKYRERDKSYKGRKISNFNDKDSNSLGSGKVNFIKFGGKSKSEYNRQPIKPKIFMDEIKDNEIFRPKLNFTSNAKPELLKYRDVKIDKKKILKKPSKELRRLNKKYSGKVPFHFGYSRKFQDFPEGKSFSGRGSSPRLTWLSRPKLSNGLPTSILHMKYPVQITRLSSGKNIHSEYFNNFI